MMDTMDRDVQVAGAVARLRVLLREHDLRCTPQRLAVVTLLAGQHEPGHLTAFQIHTQLGRTGHRLDISTVYRALTTLVEIGVLHATAHPDQGKSYGIATVPHHHALCSRCGQLGEIPAQTLTGALDQAAQISRYQLAGTSLLLNGICPRCQQLDASRPA